jgi:hypothetical protein
MENEINGKITPAKLILSASSALRGEIRPNMRKIILEYNNDEKKIVLNFFYDTPPTQEDLDYDVEGTISAEMSCFFSEDTHWEEKSYVIPYPQKITHEGICVFSRYEKVPKEYQLNM